MFRVWSCHTGCRYHAEQTVTLEQGISRLLCNKLIARSSSGIFGISHGVQRSAMLLAELRRIARCYINHPASRLTNQMPSKNVKDQGHASAKSSRSGDDPGNPMMSRPACKCDLRLEQLGLINYRIATWHFAFIVRGIPQSPDACPIPNTWGWGPLDGYRMPRT